MTDLIRRLVSGNKARFVDGSLDMELDLVYVTDQVIVMGYPAQGIEGLYRNKREDSKRFLEARHGKNFWVFNFCPLRENSYDGAFFDGRVSRYPFPDHHAPPLAILALAAREMKAWLDGSPERVVVMHCKAGKGRSGTLACSYLLALDQLPSAPKLERSYQAKEWAKLRAEDVMSVIPEDSGVDGKRGTEGAVDVIGDTEVKAPTKSSTIASEGSNASSITQPFSDTLEGVLALHTSRRMKAPAPGSEYVKQGVSIPSQRRWLYYWSLLLAHEAPASFWKSPSSPSFPAPKVKITQIKLRMRPTSSVKLGLIRVANMLIKKGGGQAPTSHVWASLARYDDTLVKTLEDREKQTRDRNGNLGKREPYTDDGPVFSDGKWDTDKMVRSFARMGTVGDDEVVEIAGEKITTYALCPLSAAKLDSLTEELKQEEPVDPTLSVASSEEDSVFESEDVRGTNDGAIVVDANRELRVKLYMGQVFMGWLWLIPAFHMQPRNGSPTRILLTKKEVDFPLGLGAGIVDVEISMEWVDSEVPTEPQDQPGHDTEPEGIAAAVAGGNLGDVVEAKQAAKE